MDRPLDPAGAVGQRAVLAVTVVTDRGAWRSGGDSIGDADPLALPLVVVTVTAGSTVAIGRAVIGEETKGGIRLHLVAIDVGRGEIGGDGYAGVTASTGTATTKAVVMSGGVQRLMETGGVVFVDLAKLGTAVAVDTDKVNRTAGPVSRSIGEMTGVGTGLGAGHIADGVGDGAVLVATMGAGDCVGAMAGGAGARHIGAVGTVVAGVLAAGYRITGESIVDIKRLTSAGCVTVGATQGSGGPIADSRGEVTGVGAGAIGDTVDTDLGGHGDDGDVRPIEMTVGDTDGAVVAVAGSATGGEISGVEHVFVMPAGVRADSGAHIGLASGIERLGAAVAVAADEVDRAAGPVIGGVRGMTGIGAGTCAAGIKGDAGSDSLAAITVTGMGAEVGVAAVAGVTVTRRGCADVDIVVAVHGMLAAHRRIGVKLVEHLGSRGMTISALVGAETAAGPLAGVGIMAAVGSAAVGVGEVSTSIVQRGGQIGATEVNCAVVVVSVARPRIGVAGFATSGKEG